MSCPQSLHGDLRVLHYVAVITQRRVNGNRNIVQMLALPQCCRIVCFKLVALRNDDRRVVCVSFQELRVDSRREWGSLDLNIVANHIC